MRLVAVLCGLLTLTSTQAQDVCPSKCTCVAALLDETYTNDSYDPELTYWAVRCVNANIETMPPLDTFPSPLLLLDLTRNSLQQLTAAELDFPYLQTLSLSYNELGLLPATVFSKLPNLISLRTGGNTVLRLADGSFDTNTRLHALTLPSNPFSGTVDYAPSTGIEYTLSAEVQQFISFDTNQDAGIVIDEFYILLQSLSLASTTEESESLFQEFDIDQNGTLDGQEFIDITIFRRRKTSEKAMDLELDLLITSLKLALKRNSLSQIRETVALGHMAGRKE